MKIEIPEDRVKNYLLGEMSEAEQIQFEDAYFIDETRLEQLLAIEDEIINDYLRDELSSEHRRRFEQYFLTTPERTARLEFARDLLGAIYESRPTTANASMAPERRSRWWQALLARLRMRNLVLAFAAAAAILLLIGGLRLYNESARRKSYIEQMRAELGDLYQQRQVLDEQIAAQRSRNEELLQDLQHNDEERKRLEEEINRLQQSQRAVLSVQLIPSGTRVGGQKPVRLVIPTGKQIVQLKLRFSTDRKYRSYHARIRTAGGEEALNVTGLRSTSSAAGGLVSLDLPSTVFAAGDYVITLSGVTNEGSLEEVEDYPLTVTKPKMRN